MASPFPEVVLRVRCGWQQFIEDVVCTVPNFRKQSFIIVGSSFFITWAGGEQARHWLYSSSDNMVVWYVAAEFDPGQPV